MNLFVLIPVTGAAFSLSLGAFVLAKDERNRVNQLFALLLVGLSLWGVAESVMHWTNRPEIAAVWSKIEAVGYTSAGVLFLDFCLRYTKTPLFSRRVDPWFIYLSLGVALLAIWRTDAITSGAVPGPWGYHSRLGSHSLLFIMWLDALGAVGIYRLFKHQAHTRGAQERRGTRYILVGALFPWVIGSLTDAHMPLWGASVPEFGTWATIPCALFIGFGILRFRVLTLKPSSFADQMVASSVDAIIATDPEGRVSFFSNGAQVMTGFQADEAQGRLLNGFFAGGQEEVRRLLEVVEECGNIQGYEATLVGKEGRAVETTVAMSRLTAAGGEVGWTLTVARDITEWKRMGQALRESEEQFRKIFEDGPVGTVLVGSDFGIIRVNAAFCRMLGYSGEELTGSTFVEVTHPEDVERDVEQARKLFAGEISSYRMEKRYVRKDGEIIWGHLTASVIRDREGSPLYGLGIVEDITERKRAEAQLAEMAYTDPLTGLANRRRLKEWAESAITMARRRQRSVALLFLDLDRFKAVNDTLGYDAGDEALTQVAQRLAGCARESDLAVRLGGDEFAILLTEVDGEEGALRAAQRIQDCFEEPFSLQGHRLRIEASIGIALYPGAATNLEELQQEAELATRVVKAPGDVSIQVYRPDLRRSVPNELGMEEELVKSLEEGRLALYYQPVVDLRSGELVGVEALTGWLHPERGLVRASEFIDLAEETGRIRHLDRWALATALRQIRAWRADGWDGWVAVNLSARSLTDPDLGLYLTELLESGELPGSALVVEVTERAAIQHTGVAAPFLRVLRALGVSLALDDFGTGYSSLIQLRRLATDHLKVDQSFVRNIGHNSKDEQLIRATIALGHSLDMGIMAEGVEEEGQREWLAEAGCDFAQGYLFGEPRPAEELDLSLRR